MTRLAEVITNEPAMDLMAIEGEKFWLELGEVDLLRSDIVPIQRDGELVGAFQRRENGTLRFAAYQPLDAKAIGYATGLAIRPAADSGACYLSRWECGLGISSDGSRVEQWYGQRGKLPQEPRFVATQIEVYLEFQHLIGE